MPVIVSCNLPKNIQFGIEHICTSNTVGEAKNLALKSPFDNYVSVKTFRPLNVLWKPAAAFITIQNIPQHRLRHSCCSKGKVGNV